MEKLHPTTPEPQTNRTWEHLEDFVREHVQQFIQALLEEEVTELLGRTKSARRETIDAAPGYRNGVCEVVRCSVIKMLPGNPSPWVTIHFSKKLNDFSHWKCYKTPEKCLSTTQLRKLQTPERIPNKSGCPR